MYVWTISRNNGTLSSSSRTWEQERGDFAALSGLFVFLFCFVWGLGHFQVLFFIVKNIMIVYPLYRK